MRPIDKSWTSKAEESLESAAVTLFDAAYETGKKIVEDTTETVTEHPYLAAAAVAAAVTMPWLRARQAVAAAEEAATVSRLDASATMAAKVVQPGVTAARAGRATEMVDIPIVKGPWKDWSVDDVPLDADHWVAKGYMHGRNSVVEVILNGERQGTGFFVDKTGLAVTNHHVVGVPNLSYELALRDGTRHAARVVSLDPNTDLAILKVLGAKREFSALELGASTGRAAEEVVALGFPEKVTSVSASPGSYLNYENIRRVSTTQRRLEFDMVMKAGNSGSPVLGTDGKVVAVLNKYGFQDTASGPAVEHLKALLQATRAQESTSKILVVNTSLSESKSASLMEQIFRRAGSILKTERKSGLAQPFTVWVPKASFTSRPPLGV
jgi:S1-C subfamily serine protease